MVTCPISFVTTPPPCILERLKAILKYLEVSEQSYWTVRCICFLRLEHSSSCHHALTLLLMQLSVCTCHRFPIVALRTYTFTYLPPHPYCEFLPWVQGLLHSSWELFMGKMLWLTRFKAKIPFYKEKYNLKCLRYSSLLGSSVLTLE